jgi:hypothetical protein
LEKERVQRTKREIENFQKKKKKLERGGTVNKRERRIEREGEFKPRKWEREKKSEREGDLKK